MTIKRPTIKELIETTNNQPDTLIAQKLREAAKKAK